MKTVTTEIRKIESLKEHAQNAAIYGEERANVEELAQKIKTSGDVKPLVINDNGVIVSGHRRYKACKMLGISELPVEVRSFNSEADELECLLLENSYRMKTIEQKVREGKIYERIEAERAKLRMMAGSKLSSPLNINYPMENLPQVAQASNYGKTRDIVAKQLNIGSGRTYEKAKKVVETIDETGQQAPARVEEPEIGVR